MHMIDLIALMRFVIIAQRQTIRSVFTSSTRPFVDLFDLRFEVVVGEVVGFDTSNGFFSSTPMMMASVASNAPRPNGIATIKTNI